MQESDSVSAWTIMGENIAFLSKVKSVDNNYAIFTHCIINCQAHLAKKYHHIAVLCDALKIINQIKIWAPNSYVFSKLCKDINFDYQTVLLHIEVILKGAEFIQIISVKRWSYI